MFGRASVCFKPTRPLRHQNCLIACFLNWGNIRIANIPNKKSVWMEGRDFNHVVEPQLAANFHFIPLVLLGKPHLLSSRPMALQSARWPWWSPSSDTFVSCSHWSTRATSVLWRVRQESFVTPSSWTESFQKRGAVKVPVAQDFKFLV